MTTTVVPYPFQAPGGNLLGAWYQWNLADGPLTVAFPSGNPIGSIWIPSVPGVISVYNGDAVNADDFIAASQGSGAETLPMPQNIIQITLSCAVSVGTIEIFISTANFDPFRLGAIAALVTAVNATAPIASSGGQAPVISLDVPLAVEYGGSGATAPSLVAGQGIDIQGEWPNQKIIALAAGTVISVGATPPLASSGGETPVISIEVPLPQEYGGTGTTTPGENAGAGISITGTWPNQTISNAGVISINDETGSISLVGTGGIAIETPSGSELEIDGSALVETITSEDGSIVVTRSGQSVDLSATPERLQTATAIASGSNPYTATINIPNPYANATAYVAWVQLLGSSGPATISSYINQTSGGQFTVTFEGDATGSLSLNFRWFTLPVP